MLRLNLSALLRLLAAITLVLFISSCDTLSSEPIDQSAYPYSCYSPSDTFILPDVSEVERQLSCLIENHPEQQRLEMYPHETLFRIARERAGDMAENGWYGGGREYPPHVDHEGYGPNHYLCEARYRGDSYCSDNPFANNVESIAMGQLSPKIILDAWSNSEGHRRHVLGEIKPFAEANHYGVGHAAGDPEGKGLMNFWVLIIARPPQTEDGFTAGAYEIEMHAITIASF